VYDLQAMWLCIREYHINIVLSTIQPSAYIHFTLKREITGWNSLQLFKTVKVMTVQIRYVI